MNLKEKRAYVGSLDQLVRITPYRMEGGRADGVRAADVCNESGLRLTVTADRCMDIAELSFKGVNMGFRNACGVVAPAYYDDAGMGWLRSFTGGFLTTCGLRNTGSPSADNGEAFGLHGRIGNTPAREFSARVEADADSARAVLSGVMEESVLFGEKLRLCRTVTLEGCENVLTLRDRVCNDGFRPEEYMLLYHFNLGYPFLSPACELFLPEGEMEPRNEWAAAHAGSASRVEPPSLTEEMCYYFRLPEDGTGRAGVFNRELGIGVVLSFDRAPLRRFVLWKNLACGGYAVGLEPGTSFVDGRSREREREGLPVLAPQSFEEHVVRAAFFDEEASFLRALRNTDAGILF